MQQIISGMKMHSNYNTIIMIGTLTLSSYEDSSPSPIIAIHFYPTKSWLVKFITWKDESDDQMSLFFVTTY